MNSNSQKPRAVVTGADGMPGERTPGESRNFCPLRTCAIFACILAVVAGASALWVDLPLAIWIRQSVSENVNDWFELIGELGESGPYIGAALTLYVLSLAGLSRGWRNVLPISYACMARGSMLLLSTLAAGGVIVLVFKRLVSRARPEMFFEKGIYGLGDLFSSSRLFHSFPSSHTYTAVAVAVVLGILAPRWRWVFLLIAMLVAMSRLVNLDHYLSDVMTAGGIAALVAYALAPRVLDSKYQWPLRAPWRWWKKS